MHLAGGGVGEYQEEVVPDLVRDQLGCGRRLHLAHLVRLRCVQRDVENLDAVELCDAVGGVRQRHAGRSARKGYLAGSAMEVQHFDEQPPDGVGTRSRVVGAEDAADVVFNLLRVFGADRQA